MEDSGVVFHALQNGQMENENLKICPYKCRIVEEFVLFKPSMVYFSLKPYSLGHA
jgi:hypothetical protein